MKVKATDAYKKLNVMDNELGRIPEVGEKFEVTEDRYNVLIKTNHYNAIFVEKIEDNKTIETAIKKVKTEKAIKKIK